ncbi:MAG: hypothetical protein PHO56_03985 [Patescibacteria group bacterium]|nr:hypothetical protein [Patescibacteria group bacterium]
MTKQNKINGQDGAIIKKITAIFCIFGGIIILMPTLFFIFFDIFYKLPLIQILSTRSPWLLISITLIILGVILLKQFSGKLSDFIKAYIINFIILNIFQIILLGIDTVRHLKENIAEDLTVAFFVYSFVIFIFCFLPAAFKVGFKLSNKYLALFSTTLGVALVVEIIFKLGYNYWTFLAFAIFLPFLSLFLKKRATR